MVLRLDKLNPLKSTLITQPKSVEVIVAYEFHQNGLGPRLLSVFKNGRIEEWIEVSPRLDFNLKFSLADDDKIDLLNVHHVLIHHLKGRPIGSQLRKDKEMQKLVAQCIARINAIDTLPAERNGNFLIEKVGVFLKLIYKSQSVGNYTRLLNFVNSNLNVDTSSNVAATVEPNADSGKNDNETNRDKIIGLENELNFLRDGLTKLACSSQLVLSHNDLSQENLFQRLGSLNEIYALSYDMAGYNFRGYDLGKHTAY